jgi:hypothetical protein
MSDTHGTNVQDQHGPTHATADAHGAATGNGGAHGDGHGHDAHGGEALGPIGWTMWGAGVLGVIAALIVVAGFVAATDFSFVA